MLTANLLHLPMLPLAEAHRLIPEVPRKLIRNLTDRQIVLLEGLRDPRLYTLINCMELSLLSLMAETDTSFSIGMLMCGGLRHRLEMRLQDSSLGTSKDMLQMVCRISKDATGPHLHPKFCKLEDLSNVLKPWLDDGYRDVRVIAVDAIIENVVALYLNKEGDKPAYDSEHFRIL